MRARCGPLCGPGGWGPMAPRVARPCVVAWAVWAVMCYVVDDTRPRPRLAAMVRAQRARAERRGVKISRPRTQCGDWPTRGPAKARHRAGPRGATNAATGRPASGRSRLAQRATAVGGASAALTAREWPLRQARAQQGPRGAQRAPGGRSLDRGRAVGPARAPPMRRGRTAATWRPGPVAGAAPSRAGWDGGGPAGPGGGARGPLCRATGGTPHPRAMRGHPLAVLTRNERRRGGPSALGAGATASGVPERAIRRPQAPNRAGAGPTPGWGPRTPPAKRWAAWWPNANPMVRAVLTRMVRRRGPSPQKKLRPRPHRGRNYPISGPNSSEPGVRPPTIGSWQAQRYVAPVL